LSKGCDPPDRQPDTDELRSVSAENDFGKGTAPSDLMTVLVPSHDPEPVPSLGFARPVVSNSGSPVSGEHVSEKPVLGKPVQVCRPTELPPELEHLLHPPPPPAGSFEPGGWDNEDGGQIGAQAASNGTQASKQNNTAPAESNISIIEELLRGPEAKAESGQDGDGDSCSTKLDFMQSMFSTMDAGVVADVLHGVNYDTEAAIEKLTAVQVVFLCPCQHYQSLSMQRYGSLPVPFPFRSHPFQEG
jgi:hypothetical protein